MALDRKAAARAMAAEADGQVARLSPEERSALREVGKGMLQRVISDAARDALIKAGLIKQVLGGLKLTDVGSLAVSLERSRNSHG